MRFPRHFSGSLDSFTPFCVRCGCVGLSVLAVGPAALWPRHPWWTCFAVLLLPSIWFVCVESSSPSALLLCRGPWGMFSFVFTFTLCVGRLCIVVFWSSRLRLQHRTRLSLLRHRRNLFFSYRDEHLLTRTGVGCGVWRDGRGVGKGWSASAEGRVSHVLGAESTQMWMRLVWKEGGWLSSGGH